MDACAKRACGHEANAEEFVIRHFVVACAIAVTVVSTAAGQTAKKVQEDATKSGRAEARSDLEGVMVTAEQPAATAAPEVRLHPANRRIAARPRARRPRRPRQ